MKFLCAAYLGEHKGIPVLLKSIQMLEELKELKGRWSVTIAGHGHLADAVTTALGRMGPNAPVEFVGRLSRSSMMQALDDADVVVLPSVWPENEPVTLLEGIASGAAILATRIGGNVEIVEDGRSGILVSPNNPEHLAQTMRKLILAPHIVAEMSQYNLSKRAITRRAQGRGSTAFAFLRPIRGSTDRNTDNNLLGADKCRKHYGPCHVD